MSKILFRHITSCGCGRTEVNGVIDIEKETYELHYFSRWMGMENKEELNITGKLIYVDCVKNPLTVHAYLKYCLEEEEQDYPDVLIEIISFPKLREIIKGTKEEIKFMMSNSDDEFDINGKILIDYQDEILETHTMKIIKKMNGLSLKITIAN